MKRLRPAWSSVAIVCVLVGIASADDLTNERVFQQPKSAVEKAVKDLAGSASGRLPMLDGFAQATSHPLDRYQKGYYECTAQVTADASGATRVKITAKITAWYSDPTAAQSGYQVLHSNGRLEADFLDRLQDTLSKQTSSDVAATRGSDTANALTARQNSSTATKSTTPAPSLSAPTPGGSVLTDAIAASHTTLNPTGNLPSAPGPTGDVDAIRTRKAVADRKTQELKKEAQNLEEILQNQSKPSNLVAVKTSDTPVLTNPNEGAKPLFMADARDEFEVLDMTESWVHVRISGLSRGWIRRSALEIPEDAAIGLHSVPPPEKASQPKAKPDGPPFEVENEQIASFPGDWDALRGKTVDIITVQKMNALGSSPQAKLDFVKSLLQRDTSKTPQASSSQGVVIIFDSEDGGMMATTLPVLQQWKSGNLSEQAFWHHSYFDPPEAFQASVAP